MCINCTYASFQKNEYKCKKMKRLLVKIFFIYKYNKYSSNTIKW